jgi:hypothetical protein
VIEKNFLAIGVTINAFYTNSIILFALFLKKWTYYELGILFISIFSIILLILATARIQTCRIAGGRRCP